MPTHLREFARLCWLGRRKLQTLDQPKRRRLRISDNRNPADVAVRGWHVHGPAKALDPLGGSIDVGDAGFELYASGAYHFYRHDPKAMASADVTGCITDQELADVKAALAKATWKVTTNEITCDAISNGHTEWTAGKHTYDAVMCGHESIDATTQKAFNLVAALETKYMPKSR